MLVPLMVVPRQVEVPLAGVPVGREDAAAATRVHPDRAESDQQELLLKIGMHLGEREELGGEYRPDVELVHLGDDVLPLRVPVEVHEGDSLLVLALRGWVEVFGRGFADQVAVVVCDPVERCNLDLLLVGQAVVDRNDVVGVALRGADHARATNRFGTLRLRHDQTPSCWLKHTLHPSDTPEP